MLTSYDIYLLFKIHFVAYQLKYVFETIKKVLFEWKTDFIFLLIIMKQTFHLNGIPV